MDWFKRVATAKGLLGAASAVLAVALGAVLLTGANPLPGAFGAPKPPVTDTPTITSGPSNPTNSTSASFSFTGPSGATFKCTRDGAAVTSPACTSGVTYTGFAPGSHTFSVTASVSGKSESSPATRTWVVDTTPPPAPSISGVDSSTSSTTAQFKLADSESNVTFRCSLDSGAYGACDKSPKYADLAEGDHCFAAKAVDAATNSSAASTFCWTIIGDKKPFQVTGSPVGQFYPGVKLPVDLSIYNPNGKAIHIDSIAVSIAHTTTKPGCDGTTNLIVSRDYSANITVPGKTTVTLSGLGIAQTQWPELMMPDLSTPQNDCKDADFTINYSGQASA